MEQAANTTRFDFETEINGHKLQARFDVNLHEGFDPVPYAPGYVCVSVTVDGGERRYSVVLDCYEDGVLFLCDNEENTVDEHERIADLLNCDFDDFETKLGDLIEAAQERFDAELAERVLNDVTEDEMATGVSLDCMCGYNGVFFECDGDGYITFSFAGKSWREDQRFRIDAKLAEKLEQIESETSQHDFRRTLFAYRLFNDSFASGDFEW